MMNHQSLNNSDWAILRILWEHGALTSGQIHEFLSATRDWRITTVKTLVSRLLQKGYLQVDGSGRYPTYAPIYSEDDCVKMEMRDTMHRIYGDILLYHSDHFSFYGDPRFDYVKDIEVIAEQYRRIIADYTGYGSSEREAIMIHRSLKNLHSAMGLKDAPSWLRVGENHGMYHIAPKEAFDDLPLAGALSYLLAMVAIDRINHDLPFYFKQGLATMLSALDLGDRIRQALPAIIAQLDDDRVLDLIVESDHIGEQRQHEIATLFVEYIHHRFGDGAIQDVLHRRRRITTLLQDVQDDFVTGWKSYLEETYAKGKETTT